MPAAMQEKICKFPSRILVFRLRDDSELLHDGTVEAVVHLYLPALFAQYQGVGGENSVGIARETVLSRHVDVFGVNDLGFDFIPEAQSRQRLDRGLPVWSKLRLCNGDRMDSG